MRIETSTLGRLINFLLGVAWASVLLGGSYIFLSYYRLSPVDALFLGLLGMFPGLLLVALLEYLIVGLKRHEEILKQTKLIEELLELTRAQNKEP